MFLCNKVVFMRCAIVRNKNTRLAMMLYAIKNTGMGMLLHAIKIKDQDWYDVIRNKNQLY